MVRRPVPAGIMRVAQDVIDSAFEVHTEIGPGCFERVYETCLAHVLREKGHSVARQVAVPFEFRGERIPIAFRVDLVVGGCVVVEVKTVKELVSAHYLQTKTYLALSGHPVGILLNFGAAHMRDGFDRLVHNDYFHLPSARDIRLASGPRALGASGEAPQGPGGS